MHKNYFIFRKSWMLLALLIPLYSYGQKKVNTNVMLILVILFLTTGKVFSQCAYAGTPLSQVPTDYIFCIDNTTSFTTPKVNAGQYVVVNVVQGFKYTFSVGNVFPSDNENLTLLKAADNSNFGASGFNSGAGGATISLWTATFSGKIKVLLSKGACVNDNSPGGAITLALNSIGNTLDSQSAFGTNQWIGHVYNWTSATLPPGGASPPTPTASIPFDATNYVGYYTIPTETITENFGGDSVCFPVFSDGANNVNILTQTFAVRYRMRSTKTGCYFLNVSGDDGIRVYVDGVLVFNAWKEQATTNYCNNLIYLSGNSDIIFDYYENSGQNVANLSLTEFVPATNFITGTNPRNVCSGVSPGLLDGSPYAPCATSTFPNVSFQWQISSDGVNFTDIPSATLEDYTPATITTSTNDVKYYRRLLKAVATNAGSCVFNTNIIRVNTSANTALSVPGTISGIATQCPGVGSQIYNISDVTNALNYTWSVPTGWSITAGQGTTSVTVTTGATGQGGNIGVIASNGCNTSATKNLAVTVSANNTSGTASSPPTLCINTVLTDITRITTGATGITNSGVSGANGLPAGVSATWVSNAITISGTPSAAGTFNYSIPLTGGCGNVNATGTITVTANRTVGAASSSPTTCISTASTNITHATTGVTSIVSSTGLPAGITATYAANIITISGTPTVSGIFNYTITPNGCGSATATGTITVTATNIAGVASSTPTLCVNTVLTNITHSTTGATAIGTPTGLPAGVTASWASNVITITGTPSVSGPFNYSIPLTGGCGNVNATGRITVTANRTVGAASSSPTTCISTAITNITHVTTGVTSIVSFTGLPAGITATYAANIITISGTPTVSGIFNYTVTSDGCGSATATGTITVTATNIAGVASSTPTVCVNTVLANITHSTTGATAIGTPTGLPAGVTASWASNVITITGIPSVSGPFNYSIPLTGGCGNVNATGTITVTANRTVGAASSSPTLCVSTAITNITHVTTGVTSIVSSTGLPAGITATYAANIITISGIPTVSGIFNYTITPNGCGSATATGTITVTAGNTVGAASSSTPLCLSKTFTPIKHPTTGATGIGTASGLPAGLSAAWFGDTITISGIPTASGIYNYSIPLTGGCGTVNATGTITVGVVTTYNSGGWSDGIPDIYKTAVIAADYYSSTGAISACSCEVKPGAVLTVNAGYSVTFQNDIINNGHIIVESDANLIQVNDAGTYTQAAGSSFTVQRNATMKRLDYTYWSSPVSGQNLKAFSPGTVNTRFLTYNEGTDQFEPINPVNNVFDNSGKGYAIRANNGYTTTPVIFPGKFVGAPNNGVKNIQLLKAANGYNLVGNPYSSNINFYTLQANNSSMIEKTAYFWSNVNPNPAMEGSGYPGTGSINNYAVLNGMGGVPATSPTQNPSATPNEYIKVGQGFIVKAKQQGMLTFTNAERTDNATSVFFNKDGSSIDRYWLKLTTPLNVVTTQLIGYKPEATNGFDTDYDAPLLVLGADAFFSTLGSQQLAIQGRSAFVNTDLVTLGSSYYANGNYTISLDKKEGVFANGQHIFVKDKQSGILTNLSAGNYTFAAMQGLSEGRFEIVYLPESVLVTDNTIKDNLIIYRDSNDFVLKSSGKKIDEVEVYDSGGRLIYKVQARQTRVIIPAEGMVNGVYVLKINQGGEISSKKIRK